MYTTPNRRFVLRVHSSRGGCAAAKAAHAAANAADPGQGLFAARRRRIGFGVVDIRALGGAWRSILRRQAVFESSLDRSQHGLQKTVQIQPGTAQSFESVDFRCPVRPGGMPTMQGSGSPDDSTRELDCMRQYRSGPYFRFVLPHEAIIHIGPTVLPVATILGSRVVLQHSNS